MKTKSLIPVCIILLIMPGCNHEKVLQPKLRNVTRGAAQIDVYGRWARKLDTLGRGTYRMTYILEFARAGSVIKVNKNTGAVTSGTLNPLQSATITTTFTVANGRATLTNPSTTTDANGRASVSIRPVSGPSGPETLTITINYPPVFTGLTDTDSFEVDVPSTTTWE